MMNTVAATVIKLHCRSNIEEEKSGLLTRFQGTSGRASSKNPTRAQAPSPAWTASKNPVMARAKLSGMGGSLSRASTSSSAPRTASPWWWTWAVHGCRAAPRSRWGWRQCRPTRCRPSAWPSCARARATWGNRSRPPGGGSSGGDSPMRASLRMLPRALSLVSARPHASDLRSRSTVVAGSKWETKPHPVSR